MLEFSRDAGKIGICFRHVNLKISAFALTSYRSAAHKMQIKSEK